MAKQWFTRLTRIASGNFGAAKEDGFSLETSLTKFERFVHFWVLVIRSFVRNRCPVRASALSYTTLLALIPMLAVGMSITTIFLKEQGKEQIRQFIEAFVNNMVPATATNLPSLMPLPQSGPAGIPFDRFNFDESAFRQAFAASAGSNTNLAIPATPLIRATTNTPPVGDPEETAAGVAQVKENVAQSTANLIYSFVENTYSGTLGVTGMVFLVLTAILTLTRVEETFNDIWGVTRGRDWWSRITNYFTTIALGPFLIIAAIGLANGPNFQKTRELMEIVPFLAPILSTYLPVAVICFTFALLYKLVPNTRVDFTAALVGGSLAGIAWHFYQQLGFLLASRAMSASAVYGSLFVIPLLMGGLYIGWLTILFGAQVAYAFQNRVSYLQERLAENVNQRGREFVALRLMTCIGQRFYLGQPPVTIRDISTELGVPGKLAQQVMRTLLTAGLVVEVSGAEAGYTPARPLNNINCHDVLLAMRATHGQEPATRDEPVRAEVLGEFARIQAAEEQAAGAVTLLNLVHRAQARLQLANIVPSGAMAIAPVATAAAAVVAPAVDFRPEPAVKTESAAAPESMSSRPVASQTPTPPAAAASPADENESFPL